MAGFEALTAKQATRLVNDAEWDIASITSGREGKPVRLTINIAAEWRVRVGDRTEFSGRNTEHAVAAYNDRAGLPN